MQEVYTAKDILISGIVIGCVSYLAGYLDWRSRMVQKKVIRPYIVSRSLGHSKISKGGLNDPPTFPPPSDPPKGQGGGKGMTL